MSLVLSIERDEAAFLTVTDDPLPLSLVVYRVVTMSSGSKAMVKRQVIVRKMQALESLGSVTNVCSDKTGTLTQGKMVLRKAWVPATGTYSVSESNEAFNPTLGEVSRVDSEPRSQNDQEEGEIVTDEQNGASRVKDNKAFMNFLNVSSLCNLATVFKDKETGTWTAHGDSTECAIQTWASRFGWARSVLTKGASDPEGAKTGDAAWTQIAE